MTVWMQVVCRSTVGLLVAAAVLALTGSWWWALIGLLAAGVALNTVWR